MLIALGGLQEDYEVTMMTGECQPSNQGNLSSIPISHWWNNNKKSRKVKHENYPTNKQKEPRHYGFQYPEQTRVHLPVPVFSIIQPH